MLSTESAARLRCTLSTLTVQGLPSNSVMTVSALHARVKSLRRTQRGSSCTSHVSSWAGAAPLCDTKHSLLRWLVEVEEVDTHSGADLSKERADGLRDQELGAQRIKLDVGIAE